MARSMNLVSLIPIKDMDRAIKFYRTNLGCKVQMRPKGKWRNLWAALRLGQNEIWLVRPEKPEKTELAYNCFVTKDIEDTVKQLRAAKIRFQKPEAMGGKVKGSIAYTDYGATAFFKDSEGNLLMLWQNPK